jgi:hypothetical protein
MKPSPRCSLDTEQRSIDAASYLDHPIDEAVECGDASFRDASATT